MKTTPVALSLAARNSRGRFTNSKSLEKRKEKLEAIDENKTKLSAKQWGDQEFESRGRGWGDFRQMYRQDDSIVLTNIKEKSKLTKLRV